MLVCSVSQLARRAAITAGIVEAAAAADAPGTGNVVFATLVDDPASVREFVDAYLGQIMLEAASASSAVNAGLVYAVRVDEAAHAVDTPVGAVPAIKTAAVAEAASAADLVDNTVAAGAAFNGALALDGPIMPANPQPTVIYIEG
jgi:hypothetical protein